MDLLKLKPSELIRTAIHDLEICEADPKYNVDMGIWHNPTHLSLAVNDTICSVCLAGTVMAQSLGADPEYKTSPCNFDEDDLLIALDHFREGDVRTALDIMGHSSYLIPDFYEVTYYWVSPYRFKIDMLNMASDLEKRGL